MTARPGPGSCPGDQGNYLLVFVVIAAAATTPGLLWPGSAGINSGGIKPLGSRAGSEPSRSFAVPGDSLVKKAPTGASFLTKAPNIALSNLRIY